MKCCSNMSIQNLYEQCCVFNKNMIGQEILLHLNICLFCGSSDKYGAQMTKQVKLAKILWQYRLSIPYHDYKPHMSCNKKDECDAGFRRFLLSRCKQTHTTRSNSLHYGCGTYQGRLMTATESQGQAVQQIGANATWQIRKELNVQFIPPLL